VHHMQWKTKIKQARMALRTLVADALVTAGYVIYCGSLDQPLRDSLLSDWLSRCETANFETVATDNELLELSASQQVLIPNENYSLEEVIGIAELLPELESTDMLFDSTSRHNAALVFSVLFCHGSPQHCTLLIDPDKQAECCIRCILQCASNATNGE